MPLTWLSKIKSTLETPDTEPSVPDSAILYATLMLEIAQADQEEADEELAIIESRLHKLFGLDEADCRAVATAAREQLAQAPGLYQFTRQINETLSIEERSQLVKSLWQVAFADQEIDKYEEASIRKISDLLYVSHGDFMKAKHSAWQESGES